MSEIAIAFASIAGLFTMILLGIPVGFALLSMSMLGMALLTGGMDLPLSLLGSTMFSAVRNYIFMVVPLFILMGSFMTNSRVAAQLFDAAHLAVRRVTGGLGISTVFANTVFSAATGVSVASAAIFSKIAMPEMQRHGYQTRLALGTIAGSSVLGMLIPPSLLMILYGLLTGVSIGSLFIAGVVPGIILAALYSVSIYLRVRRNPALAGGQPRGANRPAAGGGSGPRPTAERLLKNPLVARFQRISVHDSDVSTDATGARAGRGESALDLTGPGTPTATLDSSTGTGAASDGATLVLVRSIPVLGLVALVIGGIWGGLFSPTEASAIGALGALCVGLFSGLTPRGIAKSIRDTAVSVGSIMLLLVAAQLYSRMLALSGLSKWTTERITSTLSSPRAIVIFFVVLLLLLGMILDSSSIILLVTPLMLPVVLSAGIDPLWFGVVMIVAVEIGMLTPPFGIIPFAMSAVIGRSVKAEDVFIGAFPFVLVMLLLVALMILYPSIVTWLPSLR